MEYNFQCCQNLKQDIWKLLSCVWLFVTPWIYSPWNSPGQNTGVGSLSLLQGIFPTQGSNPGLLHCRQILYQLSQGNPRILEWVAYPFFSRSSQSRNWTGVSCIAGEATDKAFPPLQYSCLENPMDGGAWLAAVHGVAKSWTRLSDFTFTLLL